MMPSLARLACLALAVAGAAALPMSARKKHTLAETFKSIEATSPPSSARQRQPAAPRRWAGAHGYRGGESQEILVNLLKDPDSTFATKLKELVVTLKEQEPALQELNTELDNVLIEKATEKRKAEEEKRRAEAEEIQQKMKRMPTNLVPRGPRGN